MKKPQKGILVIIIILLITSSIFSIIGFLADKEEKFEFTIIDETEICAEALELIYEDNDYRYYFPCIKSDTVFIEFTNKKERITISDALEKNHITIHQIIEKSPDLFYKEAKKSNDLITMNIKDVNNRGLTLILINNTDNEYIYGIGYIVEQKENNEWIEVEGMPDVLNLQGYTLQANQRIEINQHWGWQIELPAGEYRIIKEFTHQISGEKMGETHTVSTEFPLK